MIVPVINRPGASAVCAKAVAVVAADGDHVCTAAVRLHKPIANAEIRRVDAAAARGKCAAACEGRIEVRTACSANGKVSLIIGGAQGHAGIDIADPDIVGAIGGWIALGGTASLGFQLMACDRHQKGSSQNNQFYINRVQFFHRYWVYIQMYR